MATATAPTSPGGPAEATRAPRAHRRFAWALGAVLLLTHAWALFVFGATFWIDSGVFAAFGSALSSFEEFRGLYDATGTFMYSHIGIGVPVFWALVTLLPTNLQWPALALAQHALAIAATAAVFLTAHRFWPSWWHLAGAAVLSLHPFYQSMHNALLTESIASSLLLLGIALTLRLIYGAELRRRDFWLLLLCMVLLIQVRSYAGAMLAAMAAIVLWQRRASEWGSLRPLSKARHFPWMLGLGIVAAFVAGSALLPAYRWAVTGHWFTPGLGTNALLYATWVNSEPSPALLDRIRAHGWLPEGTLSAMFARGFDYPQVREIAQVWRAEGCTDEEIRARLAALSRMIEWDRPGLLATKARCGLASCGWVSLAFTGDVGGATYQHRTLADHRQQKLTHLRWLSWVEHPSYRSFGEGFFLHMQTGLFQGPEAQRTLWAALRKHISTRSPAWRDPLRLARLPPDLWATLGLAAIGVCLWRRPPLGLILAIPLAANFAVTALSSLAGPRYAYPLLPVSVLAITLAAALLMPARHSAPPAAA